MKRKKKKGMKRAFGLVAAVFIGGTVMALPMDVEAAEKFDPAFYAATYADVVQVLGTDSQTMYNHYLTYGQKEGRKAYPGAEGGEAVEGIADTEAAPGSSPVQSSANGIVSLDKLPHLARVCKRSVRMRNSVLHML